MKGRALFQKLFLGWIEKNKGIYEILEAAKQLKKSNVVFIIGGNGKELDALKALVKENKLEEIIQLKGWIIWITRGVG